MARYYATSALIFTLAAYASQAPLRAENALPGRDITSGLRLIAGSFAPGRQPDGNTLIWQAARADCGLLVMDTGRHPEHTQQILDFAAATRQPITAVVNSHWHLDHISGNARLRVADPQLRVYASGAIEGALTGFLSKSRSDSLAFLNQPGDPAQQAEVRADVATIDSGPALLPDVRIDAPSHRTLACQPLQVGFERYAVTAGDVWLYDPARKVLAAGDLVTLPAPFLDTACPERWQLSLRKLQKLDFNLLVPGHGEPMSRRQFAVYRKAFDSLLACSAGSATKADCVAGWQRDAAPLLANDADRKLAAALVDYYMDALLRGNAAHRAALCGR